MSATARPHTRAAWSPARPAVRGAINAISQGLVDIRTQVFPLAEAAEAHRRAETGPVAGRILLAP